MIIVRTLSTFAILLVFITTHSQPAIFKTRSGKQAWEESANPIRPGVPGVSPFWNIRARQFIYAPAFDYKKVDNAVKYIYTVTPSKGNILRFESAVPFSPLSPVWLQVPIGEFNLKVEGADAVGKVLGVAGEGAYYRAAPFNGIYHSAVMPYDKSARTTLDTLYSKPHVTSWLKTKQPDFNYLNYRYPSKIFSALIVGAVTQANLNPGTEKAKQAIELARIIADYQLSISLKQGTPWAYFAPTYYGPRIAETKKEHIAPDRLFTLMGVDAGNAYLDLYNITKDEKYYNAAINIADTYKKNQLPEGSWYQFVFHETGKSSASNILIPTGIVNFLDRLKRNYNVTTYETVSNKALQWVMDNPVKTFNWQGQFEDISARAPYLNLSREQACELAMYLFTNKTNIPLAEELVRFAEDQFVIWEQPQATPKAKPNVGSNSATWITPVVQEQYVYFMPVGRTAGIMLDTYAKAFVATRKEIYLDKAKSIANTFTVVQKAHNGYYATYFSTAKLNDWLNSSIYPAKVMMEFHEMLNETVKVIISDR